VRTAFEAAATGPPPTMTDVLLARPMGFTEEPFYADDDASIQTAPKVSFGAKA